MFIVDIVVNVAITNSDAPKEKQKPAPIPKGIWLDRSLENGR